MDYRYLVETKNEFNNFLCGLLIPHIFHGIKGMFKYSENVYDQIEQKNKKGYNINNPGIINIFKKTLEGITGLNNHEIEEEYIRIKNSSGYSDWFDNLVKASFKSYVLFLTWDSKTSSSKYGENIIYDNISIKDFIHKCYITSCDYFKENPELFINNKTNKKDILDIIKSCIELAIKKTLPYNQIIKDYLEIEFNKKNDKNSIEIENIKTMVNNIINNKKYGVRPNIKNIIKEDSEEYMNIEDSVNKKIELENFIINEKKNNFNNDDEFFNKYPNKEVLIKSNEKISENNDNITSESTDNNFNSSRETSIPLNRTNFKNKELNGIIENPNNSDTSSDMISSSKSNSLQKNNILTSPIKIKNRPNDRLIKELQFGGEEFINKKKNIQIVSNKKNEFSDKFEELESFYDSMLKI